MTSISKQTTGPDFEDVDLHDTIPAGATPRCHDAEMRDLTSTYNNPRLNPSAQTIADIDAGNTARWQCWTCDCELYVNAQGVVTDSPYDACGNHCHC